MAHLIACLKKEIQFIVRYKAILYCSLKKIVWLYQTAHME